MSQFIPQLSALTSFSLFDPSRLLRQIMFYPQSLMYTRFQGSKLHSKPRRIRVTSTWNYATKAVAEDIPSSLHVPSTPLSLPSPTEQQEEIP